jgi:hypothetical protein
MKSNYIFITLSVILFLLLIIQYNVYTIWWKKDLGRTEFWELSEDQREFKPAEGFIPDEKTAAKIAELIWIPIYGKDVLLKRPYRVTLINNIWVVEGYSTEFSLLLGFGGNPYIEICKDTGKILCVTHSRD